MTSINSLHGVTEDNCTLKDFTKLIIDKGDSNYEGYSAVYVVKSFSFEMICLQCIPVGFLFVLNINLRFQN